MFLVRLVLWVETWVKTKGDEPKIRKIEKSAFSSWMAKIF